MVRFWGARSVTAACAAILSLWAAGGAVAQQFVMPGETDTRSSEIIAERQQILEALTPVTDDMLRNPPPEEWLNWRRTYNGWGYSPLDQIKRKNVDKLRVAWTWSMEAGPTTGMPLVHGGVMFVQHYGDMLQALDAETGEFLWSYSKRLPRGLQPRTKRAFALYDDKVIAVTSDLHLVALDMKTGEPVWERQVADWKKGYYYTAGPIVANGTVITGMSGCGSVETGGCFITGHDAGTGEELWRFGTIAQPGEPGGNSWNDLPAEKRIGGSVWTAGTYDPDLNLVYFGVAQPYPWNSYARGTSPAVDKPGVTNNALYTNSTVALNPETGELVWYYQHLPNDSWDLDYAFERQIIELPVNGEMRKLVVTSGKMAIIEALDAATGEFVFAKDLGLQTVVKGIDPVTGEKDIDRSLDPKPGETVVICPHPGGARSWPGVGYDPETRRMFLPLQAHCGQYTPYPIDPEEGYEGGGGARWEILPPRNNDGNIGRVDAVDLMSRETVWKRRERAPQSSASLPTAGGIVFQGTYDRYFRAYDARNGKILWQTRLNDVPNSFPITYSIGGRQYVAVMTGSGTAYTQTWRSLVPDVRNPSGSGAVLWVFALPEE